MQAWVEQGRAPDKLVATRFHANDAAQGIQMQRPVFPYPAVPVWTGLGSTDDQSSFHSSTAEEAGSR